MDSILTTKIENTLVSWVWTYLVPVLGGLVYLLHRTWLELVDKSTKEKGPVGKVSSSCRQNPDKVNRQRLEGGAAQH